jgi:Ni,Fe-hydrogenase III large subunit
LCHLTTHVILALCAREQMACAAGPLAPRKERPTNTTLFPLGPYAPPTAQPLALTLRLRGETVVGVEPLHAGYCHRGIAALVEGKTIDEALPLVEHSCCFAGTAHRIALCRALEAAAGATIEPSARATRILFLEIERILARLWLLGLTSRGMGLTHLWQTALEQREALIAALETATSARAFWGIATPGGVRAELEIDPLRTALEQLDATATAWRAAVGPQGALGRTGKGMGALTEERARALGLRGPAGAGSYADEDARRTDEGYEALAVEWPSADQKRTGDVAARLAFAVEDLAASLALTQKCLAGLPAGESGAVRPLKLPTGDLSLQAVVEGPHGPVTLTATHSAASTLHDLRIETAAPAALAAVPEALEGKPLAHALPTLASLDLCLECLDQ